jgi:hypothetical protein
MNTLSDEMNVKPLLDHPITKFLVIALFSLASAYIFWKIGGNFAKVVSAGDAAGVSFELGGAIAGFVIVFYASLGILKRIHDLPVQMTPGSSLRRVKVFLIPREMFRFEDTYTCNVRIYDEDKGEDRTDQIVPHRENGHLTIDLRDLRDTERFQIHVTNSSGNAWKSEFHHPAAPRAEMYPL